MLRRQDGPDVARVEGAEGADGDQDTQRGSAPTQQDTQGDLEMREMDCADDDRGNGGGVSSDLPDILPGDSAVHEGDDRHVGEGGALLPAGEERDVDLPGFLPGDSDLHAGEDRHARCDDSELPEGEGQDGHSELCVRDERAVHAAEDDQGAEMDTGFGGVEMGPSEGNSNNQGPDNTELGDGVHAECAYDVPLAWRRVLEAWNDPAVGAGLADSVLSAGEFEHAVHHLDDSQHSEAGDVEGAGGDLATAGPSSSPAARGSSSTESTDGGLRQTNLKSWLK